MLDMSQRIFLATTILAYNIPSLQITNTADFSRFSGIVTIVPVEAKLSEAPSPARQTAFHEEIVFGSPLPLWERDRVRGSAEKTYLLLQTKIALDKRAASPSM